MGVRIIQGPVWSRLEAEPEVLQTVHKALTVKSPDARHSATFRKGYWDGTYKFLRLPKGIFLTGFTQRICSLLEGVDGGVRVVPVRRSDRRPFAERLTGTDAREYQAEGIKRFFAELHCRGALQCPTGSGKSEIGLEIFRRLGQNCLWVTHLKDLAAQTIERAHLRLPGLPVGLIGNGTMDPQFPLTVAMVQTLKDIDKGDPFWDAWRFVVFDECHHASAGTWFDVGQRLRFAPYRLALSGTAVTKDPVRDMRLEGMTGPTVNVVSSAELVEQGYLAKHVVHLLRAPAETFTVGRDYPHLNPRGADRYNAVYQAGIIENEARNDMICETARRHVLAGDKILVLVTRLQHGEALREQIRGYRCWVEWLSGKEPLDRRRNVLDLFRNMIPGSALVASVIFNEGVDIPELDSLIIAGGGESDIRTTQQRGRALRPRPGKGEVKIYDFLDGLSPLKGTKVQASDYLALHSRARVRSYESAKIPIVYVK